MLARIDDGAAVVAVVPVGLAVDDAEGSLRDPDLLELHRRLDDVGRAHPDVELQYVGPPFDHAPALEAAVAALRPAGSEEPALLAGAIDRAFEGDLDRFARFMAALQAGVPAGHPARAPRAPRCRASRTRPASRSTRAGLARATSTSC